MMQTLEDKIATRYGEATRGLLKQLLGDKIPRDEAVHAVCLRATARSGDITLSDGSTRLRWDSPLNEPPPVVSMRRVPRINV